MRKTSTGLFALAVIGGYFAYRNRYRIQQMLESYGVKVPMDTSSVTNAMRSGLAKMRGQAQHQMRSVSGENQAA